MAEVLWLTNSAIIIQQLEKQGQVTREQASILGIMFMLGMAIGSYLWGYIGDRYGRQYGFKASVFNLVIGA